MINQKKTFLFLALGLAFSCDTSEKERPPMLLGRVLPTQNSKVVWVITQADDKTQFAQRVKIPDTKRSFCPPEPIKEPDIQPQN